ncbi:MAG: hypothetical protein IPO05_18370 [Flavobacteriales bacterium]|nr:hypothetical protein [Flavobacteriales bacterium]
MAADSEVKLILTAKDDLTKTLGQVEEVINNLVKSQDKLADSSSDAQKSMGDLRAELNKLEAVRKSLLDQQGQLDKYKAETQASEQLAKKLEDQRLELEKLNAAKAAAKTNLDNQKAEVAASVKAVEAATEEAAAINRLSASRKALKKEAADQTRILREMSAALKENANATEQDKQAVLNQKAAVAAANDALAKQKATLGSLQAAQAERKKQLADQIAKEKELRGVLAEQERSARLQQAATADTNKALERKAASVERVTAALKGYGIETTDLVSAQNKLVEVATKVRTGLDAVGNEITNFDTGAKAARQAASRLAEDATKAADRLGKATIDGAFTGAAVPIQKVSAAIREILDPATKAERSIEALGQLG